MENFTLNLSCCYWLCSLNLSFIHKRSVSSPSDFCTLTGLIKSRRHLEPYSRHKFVKPDNRVIVWLLYRKCLSVPSESSQSIEKAKSYLCSLVPACVIMQRVTFSRMESGLKSRLYFPLPKCQDEQCLIIHSHRTLEHFPLRISLFSKGTKAWIKLMDAPKSVLTEYSLWLSFSKTRNGIIGNMFLSNHPYLTNVLIFLVIF